jgi:adenine-specific DNA-methyltransferase
MGDKDTQTLEQAILELLPADGSAVGNISLKTQLTELGIVFTEKEYTIVTARLIQQKRLGKGRGRGGSLYQIVTEPLPENPFLEQENAQKNNTSSKPKKKKNSGPRKSRKETNHVLSYRHDDKRKNNPHVGMVDTYSDGVEEKNVWQYDPHLDPELQFDSCRYQIEKIIDDALESQDSDTMQQALQELKRLQTPFLNWAGKAERTSFEVDTVSLHVHERIDPATILGAAQKRIKNRKGKSIPTAVQMELFNAPFENLPLRDAIDFYKHDRDWANRLIAGDSLLVMNSLIQKESMAGQVQMLYFDPPYGIKYGSNFQPFVNKRNVTDRKDEDLTQEPEMIKAFRDTWELGIHSYLTYLRDRLFLAKELLHESGSIFVQISDENVHHVRELMDEVFGVENFCAQIIFRKTTTQSGGLLPATNDLLIWYSKEKSKVKFRDLFQERAGYGWVNYDYIRSGENQFRKLLKNEKEDPTKLLNRGGLIYRRSPLTSPDTNKKSSSEWCYHGNKFTPGKGHWKTSTEGLQKLSMANRLEDYGTTLSFRRYTSDYPYFPISDTWVDTASGGYGTKKTYVVQTNEKVIQRCLLMTTDPGDLVLDPTCGSGTTAFVAEKWGRRWITCDTSRVAVTLAKQRLMTASYDYYDLKYPQEGIKGGFVNKTVPHITLKSIANNLEIDEIYTKLHPSIESSLTELNKKIKGSAITYKVIDGGRKGEFIDFSASDDKTVSLPSGETAKVNALLEWEVPFDFPDEWPKKAKSDFDNFHKARQKMQKKMDESIASHAGQEVLYDQPQVSKTKLRITGPFTVEAVPFATVLGLDEAETPKDADMSVARSGATYRHVQWREELIKAGIRGKGGQRLMLQDLETIPGAHYIHAVGTVIDTGERAAVSFGPEYAALEQRQVEIAMREAGDLFPLPKLLVFCAFTFDPEAAKDIDNIKGIQALKVQMNADILTEDLKKGRSSNETFWLMGQPEVEMHELKNGDLWVEVHGFDYFDTKTGKLKSGGKKNIAMWLLDTDYDNRSLFACQIFFPMAGRKDGWNRLRKDIRAELDESQLDRFHGTKSIPFQPGENKCIAVKIVDDRGIESLKVIRLDK